MCHHQHMADTNPLEAPGDKDITAHVDFSAIAEAGLIGNAVFAGYTTQANFLINCGITDKLATYQNDTVQYAKIAAGVQRLLAPQEMANYLSSSPSPKATRRCRSALSTAIKANGCK